MTSKYFGKFLVEKGVISQDSLVDALIEQIANTPPLCQVIYKNKIIATPKIFEAFRFQQDHQVEFMQACISIGAWTKEVQEKVYSVLDEVRKPLGHILVSKGLIDLKKLTMMLDEFLSQLSAPLEGTAVPIPEPVVPEPLLQEVVEIEEIPLADTSEMVEAYQPGILMELEETFEEKKRKIVKVALMLIKDNAAVDPEICKKLFQDIFKIVHTLNGLLGLLALDKLSELLTSMETYLLAILPEIPQRSAEQLLTDTQLLSKGIEMAWSMRTSILEHANEKTFFNELSSQNDFFNLTKTLKG